MALHTLEFDIEAGARARALPVATHVGVTGSSDLEVLMQPEALGGKVAVRIVTPVTGFDDLWKRVLGRFVDEAALTDTRIEINDNNATPAVVLLRLNQAFAQASTES
ncbi:malonate decarboxylase acyl carrier protein (plasmid) [Cereibacter sphaeroides]|uniref:malonate decarboxylase acyl carrier protein n=1 Tax=Cereibacter sphaeroides TaxID=1063 RepID=UPI0002A36016|nr:malonate decarboxylase acyl carrier protein [Cereibacter sphaeroides]AZB57966.1 malonate decarboxylase acyl carrier protein [Cereibacter sphaeroides]EKX56745.1 Malonate decarboxylase delta subunit [Rhodobacter sp. AKP1]